MTSRIITCAKLKEERLAIDEESPEGRRALKTALLIGGPEMQRRVRDEISADAWVLWTDHMRMILNEYGLDPTSDEADSILREHMQAFFFGDEKQVPGYTPRE
jgi:Fe-S cluster biosynthesis and repair protein YggX